MKNKLCGIGEALIDFIPEVKGQRLKDVPSFKRVAGGAPANVVGAVTKLGIPSKFLTKLGDDPFGDYIVEVLDNAGIDTSNIERDKEGETALAFVSLASDGKVTVILSFIEKTVQIYVTVLKIFQQIF